VEQQLMGAKYTHDYKVLGDAVLRSGFMEGHLVSRALDAQAVAEHLAGQHEVTGQFQSSFVIESNRSGGGKKHDRPQAVLRNVDPNAVSIELGHDVPDGLPRKGKRRNAAGPRKHVEGLHILTRALDEMGS
jgi:hypothetical protein